MQKILQDYAWELQAMRSSVKVKADIHRIVRILATFEMLYILCCLSAFLCMIWDWISFLIWVCICLRKQGSAFVPRHAEQVVIILSSELQEEMVSAHWHVPVWYVWTKREQNQTTAFLCSKLTLCTVCTSVHWSHERAWLSTCVLLMMPHLTSPTASQQLPGDESEWNPRLVGLHSQLRLFI